MNFRVKDIPGCEGVLDIYVVDTEGNVFSEDKGCFIKPYEKENGYLQYSLKLEKARSWKKMYAHRLVALAFIENIEKLPNVNHKDENKRNNKLENLEWCDHKYNCNYGKAKEKMIKSKKEKNLKVYNLKGEVITEGLTLAECSRIHFGRKDTRIKNKYAKGLIFTEGYKTPEELDDIISKANVKPVELLDVINGNRKVFKSGREINKLFDGKVNVTDAIRNDWLVHGKYKIKLYKISEHKETKRTITK